MLPRPIWPSPRPTGAATTIQLALGYGSALAVLATDLGAKAWISTFTPVGWSRPVTHFFSLVHVLNTGAAFSFLVDAGAWWGYVLVATALIIAVWLLALLQKPMRLVESLAYGLILGGAVANGLDRARHGHVVDFLDFHWRGWHWPAFNIADMGIVLGVVLIVLSALTTRASQKPIAGRE